MARSFGVLAPPLVALVVGACAGVGEVSAPTPLPATTSTSVDAQEEPTEPPPAAPAEPVETVAALSGRLLHDGAEVAFVLSVEGDWRVEVLDGAEAHAFDARARALHQRDATGDFEHVNLAPSGPDSAHQLLDRLLPLTLVSRGAHHVSAATVRDGRWPGGETLDFTDHFRRPGLEDGAFGDGPTDHVWASLDRETRLPVAVTHVADQRPFEVAVRRWDVLSVDVAAVGRDVFRLWDEVPAPVIDHGFARVGAEIATARVGYAPPRPTWVPAGFREVDLVVASDPLLWWSYPSNPPSRRVAVVTYRRGATETLTVTARAADTGAWQNPYHRGDMDLTGVDHRLPSGERVTVVEGPWPFWPVTHAWGIVGDLVITVGGDVSIDELLVILDGLVIDAG